MKGPANYLLSDNNAVERVVAFVAGAFAAEAALLNIITMLTGYDYSLLAALAHPYVWSPVVFAAIFILTGIFVGLISRVLHVAVFVGASLIAATTSTAGDITSSLYLIFGLILLEEYRFPRLVQIIVSICAVVAYTIVLAFRYFTVGNVPWVMIVQSYSLVVVFMVFYGSVYLRRYLEKRHQAEILEVRVQERTKELESALSERMIMMQEIHHRVKNNLQIVASLLRLENDKNPDPAAKLSLDNSIRRIRTMAIVHETLYQNEPLHAVDLGSYARKVVENTTTMFSDNVTVKIDNPRTVIVAPDFAIPFGLILSELLSNAAKHAFPEHRTGTVSVAIQNDKGFVELLVTDDGVGLDPLAERNRSNGLGLKIVEALVGQESATLSLEAGGGTRWRVSFPPAELAP